MSVTRVPHQSAVKLLEKTVHLHMHYTSHKKQLQAFPCTFDLALLITKRHHKLTYNNVTLEPRGKTIMDFCIFTADIMCCILRSHDASNLTNIL